MSSKAHSILTPTIGDAAQQLGMTRGLQHNGAPFKIITGRAYRREVERRAKKLSRQRFK
jgi:hypothetical protein